MRLIFVRHGDTDVKVEDRVQSVENPLSEAGIKQAQEVVSRLADYNIDFILSSELPRARDTAIIISKGLQKKLIFNKLLAEVKWPSALEGKKLDDPEVIEYKKLRNEKSVTDPNWHYSDEENFVDLKIRARKFLNELGKLKGENILAITHSTFMKVVISVMCHGDNVTWPIYADFLNFTRPKHTSISTFNLTGDGKWHLDSWNM